MITNICSKMNLERHPGVNYAHEDDEYNSGTIVWLIIRKISWPLSLIYINYHLKLPYFIIFVVWSKFFNGIHVYDSFKISM